MSKSAREIDHGERQMTIFEALKALSAPKPTTEGQLKIVDRLRGAMRSAIKSCPLSRHQIAGEMSHLLGETITKEIIDSWTRESDELNGRPARHIPAEHLPAFCQVTGSHDCLRLMCQAAGMFVLPGPDALRAEIQRINEEIRMARERKRKREMFLKEIEKGD